MSVTDLELIKTMTYQLLENGSGEATGTSLLTSMFSIQQIIDSINNAQRRFMMDTAAIQIRSNIGGVAGQTRYTLPENYIQSRRLSWETPAGVFTGLVPSDTWQFDNGQSMWAQDAGTPVAYSESGLPTRTVEIAPTPIDTGTIGLLYVALSNNIDGTGIAMTVPDDYTPVIKWLALAQLFNADGVGYDPQRGSYCMSRYAEGVELCKVLFRSIEGNNHG